MSSNVGTNLQVLWDSIAVLIVLYAVIRFAWSISRKGSIIKAIAEIIIFVAVSYTLSVYAGPFIDVLYGNIDVSMRNSQVRKNSGAIAKGIWDTASDAMPATQPEILPEVTVAPVQVAPVSVSPPRIQNSAPTAVKIQKAPTAMPAVKPTPRPLPTLKVYPTAGPIMSEQERRKLEINAQKSRSEPQVQGPSGEPEVSGNGEPQVKGPKGGPTAYLVKQGDSLNKIAEQIYGDSRFWVELCRVNTFVLDGKCDDLRAGMHIVLPIVEE